MESYAVKLKVNLKVSSGETYSKGLKFSGPLKDLPDFVVQGIKNKDRFFEVNKNSPTVEVPESKVEEAAVSNAVAPAATKLPKKKGIVKPPLKRKPKPAQ